MINRFIKFNIFFLLTPFFVGCSEKKYTVNLYCENILYKELIVSEGSTIQLPSAKNTPSKVFEYWEYNGQKVPFSFRVTENINLISHYHLKHISFKPNGGKIEFDTLNVVTGEMTDKLPGVSYSDLVFQGWRYSNNILYSSPFVYIYDGDITLTAEYKKEFDYIDTVGGIEITHYNGFSNNVIIPSVIENKNVKSVANSTFKEKSNIKNIEIPSNIDISDGTLCPLVNLERIKISTNSNQSIYKLFNGNIPSSLENLDLFDEFTAISPNLFENLSNKSFNVFFNDSITFINEASFLNCNFVKTLNFSNNLTKINDYAFFGCKNLKSVIIPDTVNYLGKSCFYDCEILENINIPTSISNINEYSFFNTSINEIIIPDNILVLKSGSFENCRKLKKVVLSNAITDIESGAFYGCNKLKKVVIPMSVNQIGNSAFNLCTSLTHIYLENTFTPTSWNKDWNKGTNATICWYSQNPNYDGFHWRYVNNEPKIWVQ